jgi:hypothetical protein
VDKLKACNTVWGTRQAGCYLMLLDAVRCKINPWNENARNLLSIDAIFTHYSLRGRGGRRYCRYKKENALVCTLYCTSRAYSHLLLALPSLKCSPLLCKSFTPLKGLFDSISTAIPTTAALTLPSPSPISFAPHSLVFSCRALSGQEPRAKHQKQRARQEPIAKS